MGVKLTGPWKRIEYILDPVYFSKEVEKNLAIATALNAKKVEAWMRGVIKKGGFAENEKLTIAIKGSSKPLVDRGDLFKAITSLIISKDLAFVGVLKKDEKNYNIAKSLHKEQRYKVDPKMRSLFYLLWLASIGVVTSLEGRAKELWDRKPGGWKPLDRSTTEIYVPARPFVDKTFDDPELHSICINNWRKAVAKTFKKFWR